MATGTGGVAGVNAPSNGGCSGASGRTGTKYTYAQLEGLWISAGGSKALASVMAAIAMAESAGCSAAFNPSGASGLWQVECPINAQYIPGGCGNVFNAQDNAKAAVAIQKAQGLPAWSTYTNGAYKAFVNNSTTPVGVNSTTASTTANTGGANECIAYIPAIGLGPISTPQLCFFSKTNARALIGGLSLAAGGTIMVVGLSVLTISAFGHTKAGKAAGKVVGTAGEAAGVAATVAGFPEIGAGVARAGSKAKGGSRSSASRYTGRKAQASRQASKKATSDANAQARNDEAQYKRVAARKNDSNGRALRPAERAQHTPNETGRDRARRMANPPKGTAKQREAVPF
jgi:hypothetical protein